MPERRLLLLSNSTNYQQEYLQHAEGPIKRILGSIPSVLFVPYAGVTVSFQQYKFLVGKRFEAMGYELESIHDMKDPRAAVRRADAIAVGGGNTFHLLHHLYEADLIPAIRERAMSGMPYIGWSAGSNVTCPTIKTTNDMPIVELPSFDALGLVPFQINPHYLDSHPNGHQGETREQRILEFVEANPDVYVVGLREGSILSVLDSRIELLGERTIRVFKNGVATKEFGPNNRLEFLLG
ncbi:MAG: dipeptidase PepE [Candidatus Krumholzibacteria bacterium]|nr:dipeptidase PepE [Candidatus Krumholzibacteria bacterium]